MITYKSDLIKYIRCTLLSSMNISFLKIVKFQWQFLFDILPLALLARIEDVVNKVVLCAEFPVATACKMFMPHRGNCFGE